MRGQQLLVILASTCLWAQVPSDQPPNNPPAIPDTVSVEANVRYGKYPETVLDILRPKEKAKGKRPGVLLIHGGGWVGGTKEQRVEYAAMKWIQKGFVVANVEYRMAKVATAPAAVSDVLEAAQWFRKNAGRYGVDANRIAVTGDSAGGHLSLMVAMTPKSAELGPAAKVAAVVDFYGITDVGDQLDGTHKQHYAVAWVPEQAGRETLARRVSPMTYVRKDVPPVFILHGDDDKTVPYEHSANLAKELRNAGGDVRLITAPGQGHGMPAAKLDEAYEQIWAFLREKGVLR
jgi:acetyl esterase/lipase